MRIIYNKNIEGHKEYQENQLNLYNSKKLKFKKRKITPRMIEEYTKFFIYNNKEFMAVGSTNRTYPLAYYKYIKQYESLVDVENKIILFKRR